MEESPPPEVNPPPVVTASPSDDEQAGWPKTLASAVVQGLIRAVFDSLFGRGGGKGLI
jgi:hypothetical protein